MRCAPCLFVLAACVLATSSAAEAQDNFTGTYRPIINGKPDQTYYMTLRDNGNGTLTGRYFAVDAAGNSMNADLEGRYFLTKKPEQGDWLLMVWGKSENRENQGMMALTAYVDNDKNKLYASTCYANTQDKNGTRGAKGRGGSPSLVYVRD